MDWLYSTPLSGKNEAYIGTMIVERGHVTGTLNNALRGPGARELSTGLSGDVHREEKIGYSIGARPAPVLRARQRIRKK